ncbi:MAG: NAD-dependent epimerase/dehydratase family protein, partial [Chloroflexi bacterium]|nr:NAD-dependent epimerase/dehydratase family protein [Chloroflexota bacterium]
MSRLVLVTGGAGFIGSHTVDLLVARGDTVRVLDALIEPVHQAGIWPAYLSEGVQRIHGSVEDPATLRDALDGVDAVISVLIFLHSCTGRFEEHIVESWCAHGEFGDRDACFTESNCNRAERRATVRDANDDA